MTDLLLILGPREAVTATLIRLLALANLKADVNQGDNDGKTPLQHAEEGGHANAVVLLQGMSVASRE